jgi:hypothetical protein
MLHHPLTNVPRYDCSLQRISSGDGLASRVSIAAKTCTTDALYDNRCNIDDTAKQAIQVPEHLLWIDAIAQRCSSVLTDPKILAKAPPVARHILETLLIRAKSRCEDGTCLSPSHMWLCHQSVRPGNIDGARLCKTLASDDVTSAAIFSNSVITFMCARTELYACVLGMRVRVLCRNRLLLLTPCSMYKAPKVYRSVYWERKCGKFINKLLVLITHCYWRAGTCYKSVASKHATSVAIFSNSVTFACVFAQVTKFRCADITWVAIFRNSVIACVRFRICADTTSLPDSGYKRWRKTRS